MRGAAGDIVAESFTIEEVGMKFCALLDKLLIINMVTVRDVTQVEPKNDKGFINWKRRKPNMYEVFVEI